MNVDVEDEQQLFDFIGSDAIEKNFAKLGYISGLEKRELSYPTGLQFPDIPIALPHVDSKYIGKPFIYIARTKKVLKVRQMGDGREMSTNNFLFLGIKNASKQPELLAHMMNAFQNKEFVQTFLKIDSNEQMLNLMNTTFEKLENVKN
ncbi:pts system, galactitol-specific iia component [Pediococcus cellicola]|uniref:Pts system, galactitol-specific iia component n=1 Tax=Pediococcus cellicola TaxID=319652 RepID=A0A0R2ISZ2_9LACO|nr:pts system, galactitol-specific iia component [Pediococcus cellicola]